MQQVFVAGAGMTRIGRRSESLPALMTDAARTALAEAGRESPEAIVVATMNPEEFLGDGNFASHVATHMGFANVPALRVETATSSGAAAFYTGFAEVAAGLHRRVLVVGGEKMTHLSTPRVSEPLRLLHCCPISDGAAAVVLVSEPTRVRVAGVGQGTDTLAVRHRISLTAFRATQ